MELYQIVEVTEAFNHAGTKATADVAAIADRLGFRRVNIKMDTAADSAFGKIRRQIGYFRDWKRSGDIIAPGSVLLLQHPFHHKQLTREKTLRKIKEKGARVISLVHDVEELRGFRYSDYYAGEFRTMLELADIIIVHNDVMKKWFISRGVEEEKLISLGIFDYLRETGEETPAWFEKSIMVAGNLDTKKCGYIGQLGRLEGVRVHLYGPNYDEKLRNVENIEYHGSWPVDEIPSKLDRGFGLVWDGEDISGCVGESGQYLRYNNPHKLSLYLSAGLPVILWSGAAETEFVRENGVGICVEDLRELGKIFEDFTPDRYRQLLENVKRTGQKIREGYYGSKAVSEALARLEIKNRGA